MLYGENALFALEVRQIAKAKILLSVLIFQRRYYNTVDSCDFLFHGKLPPIEVTCNNFIRFKILSILRILLCWQIDNQVRSGVNVEIQSPIKRGLSN